MISSDARFYWLSQGDPGNAACCAGGVCRSADGAAQGTLGRNATAAIGPDRFATLSTCLELIEIVDSCYLQCPVCYSDSPLGAHSAVSARPLAELMARIQGVIDRKGRIEILRGTDLRDLRERALIRCAEMDLPVTLAMTMTQANLPHLWDAVDFGLGHPHVHGITFQPRFQSGRTPLSAASGSTPRT